MVGKLWISLSIWHQAIEIWRILPPVRILMTRWNRNVPLIWELVLIEIQIIIKHITCKIIIVQYWHREPPNLSEDQDDKEIFFTESAEASNDDGNGMLIIRPELPKEHRFTGDSLLARSKFYKWMLNNQMVKRSAPLLWRFPKSWNPYNVKSFLTDISLLVAQIKKFQKTRWFYFLILLLGGPSPPSQLVPNPFNWSPNTFFTDISLSVAQILKKGAFFHTQKNAETVGQNQLF